MDNEKEQLLNGGRAQITCRLALAFFACNIGSSFQFGYNTGVVNAPQKAIENFLNASSIYQHGVGMSNESITLWWSAVVSIWIIGGMIGGLTGGSLADMLGRKGSLLLCNIILVLGGFLMFISKSTQSGVVLAAGRFFTGIHSGVSTCVAPMYLSEVAPLTWRGFAGTLNQLTIVFGILVSQILGLESLMGNETYWNVLLGLTIIPAVLQLFIFSFCPESPRYLYINQQRKDRALQALQWLHGVERAGSELKHIEVEEESRSTRQIAKMSVWTLLCDSSLRHTLCVSIMLQVSQQLTGINAVIYYSTDLLGKAGLSLRDAQYATLGSSGVNLAMTLVSAVLVDLTGRRTLQLLGLGGAWLFSILLTISLIITTSVDGMKYVSVAAVFGFVISFAVGPGSIPWFMVSEMFTQSQRAAAVSIAVFVNWLSNFIVGISFPSMQEAMRAYSFIPFIVISTVVWIYLYLRMPETKNRTVTEISAQLAGGQPEGFKVTKSPPYNQTSPNETWQ